MLYEISYDYSQMVPSPDSAVRQPGRLRTYTRNVVGECNGVPVGYGPGAKYGRFSLHDLVRVVAMLEAQLGTQEITLHLHPSPHC